MKTNTPGSGNINGRTGSGDQERPLSTVGQNCRAKQQTAQLEREAGAHTQASPNQAGSSASRPSYGELTGDFLGIESLINLSFTF